MIVCHGIAIEVIDRGKATIELDKLGYIAEASIIVRSELNAALILLEIALDKSGRSLNRYVAVRHEMEQRFGDNPINEINLSKISKKDHVNWNVWQLIERIGFEPKDVYSLYQWLSSFEHCDGFSILVKYQYPDLVQLRYYVILLYSLEFTWLGLSAAGAEFTNGLYYTKRDEGRLIINELLKQESSLTKASSHLHK